MDRIHVAIRFRSFSNALHSSATSDSLGSSATLNLSTGKISLHRDAENDRKHDENHVFNFDYVFDHKSTQKEIYDCIGKNLVSWVCEGYNSTIFAFGPSGTGKTYSLFGKKGEERGIIPRCCESIFLSLNSSNNIENSVKCSFVEIYCENIRDLLSSSSNSLQIRQDSKKGMYVRNCVEKYVYTCEDVLNTIKQGAEQRATASTNINNTSSRSHAILTLYVYQKLSDSTEVHSKINLVDLAGSENIGKSEVVGINLQEAQQINKSLSCLGNVINALTEKNRSHIPYRDSKLTFLLQDSIGGNSKTVMLATALLKNDSYFETVNTLKFAQRVKLIKNTPTRNIENKENLHETILQLQKKIKELEEKYAEAQVTIEELKNAKNIASSNIEKEEIFLKKISRLEKKVEFLKKENLDLDSREKKFLELLEEQKNLCENKNSKIENLKFENFRLTEKIDYLRGFFNSLKDIENTPVMSVIKNFSEYILK